jgi:hypothetical protein
MYVPRNPYFSEFSYGYAVTEELVRGRGSRVTVAPIFPSLIEEGQVGFDVLIRQKGIPLFLQFKLAHQLERNTAAEARNGDFVAPFYRMYLRCAPECNQHALLLALESEGQRVLYTAPAFHLASELDEAYRLRQVWNRSFQIKPSEIGSLSAAPHHVSFQKPGSWRVFSAESTRSGETKQSAAIIRDLERALGTEEAVPLHDQIGELDSTLTRIFVERKNEMEAWEAVSTHGLEANLTPLQRVSYLARSFFDCQLFVATEKFQAEGQTPRGQ